MEQCITILFIVHSMYILTLSMGGLSILLVSVYSVYTFKVSMARSRSSGQKSVPSMNNYTVCREGLTIAFGVNFNSQ